MTRLPTAEGSARVALEAEVEQSGIAVMGRIAAARRDLRHALASPARTLPTETIRRLAAEALTVRFAEGPYVSQGVSRAITAHEHDHGPVNVADATAVLRYALLLAVAARGV